VWKRWQIILTVIELTEPVVMAAAGSPSFKIERQGNKVLIQPIEEDATTNLLSGPHRDASATSCSCDFDCNDGLSQSINSLSSEKIEPRAANKEPGPWTSRPRNQISGDANAAVKITGVIQIGEQLLIRYEATSVVRPDVFELKSPRSTDSLRDLRYTS
jgi:hypothetical protein